MKVRGAAAQLADEFDAVLADVIRVAESCNDEQWTRRVIDEERSVGVLFDHIAAGNDQSTEWASTFLGGRGVEVDRGLIDSENAAHAREARVRARATTMERLRASTARTSKFLHAVTDEQLEPHPEVRLARRQGRGVLGPAGVPPSAAAPAGHPPGAGRLAAGLL